VEENQASTATQDDDEISLLDIALVLAENWKPLVVTPLAVGLIALGISFLIPPTYRAVTRILPPAQTQGASAALATQLGALAGLVGPAAGLKNPADQYVALIESRSVFDAMIERFNLKELYDVRYLDDARKKLEERTNVRAGAKDGLIAIEVEDHDPQRAASIANAFVEELRHLSKTLAITEAEQRRLFFEEQLSQAKDNLTKAQIALQASGVSEAALRTLPQSALESLARLKAQITAHEIKLASMRTFMTDSNPEFRLVVTELAALRDELGKAEQSSPVKTVNNGAEYITKYRDFKYHETLFELMAKQYELARLDEAREGAVIQVVDAAIPPERKSKPKHAQIAAISFLVVFVVSLVVILVGHSLRSSARLPRYADRLERVRRYIAVVRRT
jgi:uncharacterized protein involved in exopolysaccharide biosynthesis